MIYRPVRQRDPQSIVDMIETNIASTGHRQIGFLSLNACDYPPLLELIKYISETYKKIGINVSLPSLRIESISDVVLDMLARLPRGGFTIAPEAGSERLRRVINKDIPEAETLDTVEKVSSRGWDSIKAYFMIGLPSEETGDVTAIAELANKMEARLKSKRGKITVSVSNFVPKPHTPFQWESQLDAGGFSERLEILKSSLKNRRISLKWSDPGMSEIEGLLSRGDEKISAVIYDVFRQGEVFSSWGSMFDYRKWQKAIQSCGIKISDYLGSRKTEDALPWDNINSGIDRTWLIREKKKAYSEEMTPHCINGKCSSCNICSGDNLKNIIADRDIRSPKINMQQPAHGKEHAIRVLFVKKDAFRWMGHFELMAVMEKALLKSGFPVAISSGFNPSPLMSFCPPAGIGVESEVEMMDVFFSSYLSPEKFIAGMNSILPGELGFKNAWNTPLHGTSIFQLVREYIWEIRLYNSEKSLPVLEKRLENLKNTEIEIERKGKKRTVNMRDYFEMKSLKAEGNTVIAGFSLKYVDGKTIKPIEVLRAVMHDINEREILMIRKGIKLDGCNTYY
ncbi:MAG: DUF2344 domain-containing protein [Oligoflexia bacterium]|nr:DUF2344 domain-containing protein [Oligoflexia bacterium]